MLKLVAPVLHPMLVFELEIDLDRRASTWRSAGRSHCSLLSAKPFQFALQQEDGV